MYAYKVERTSFCICPKCDNFIAIISTGNANDYNTIICPYCENETDLTILNSAVKNSYKIVKD